MRLVNARIETLHRQLKIHRIQIVEVTTPKREAADGNRARQRMRDNFCLSIMLKTKQLNGHSRA
jgi:hypothetical protein